MTTSHRLDFRSLDAADATLTPGQQQRADALLERIVATPVTPEAAVRVIAPRQKRLSRRVIWLPAAAAVVAVGGIVFPGFGGSDTAYASWTATPSPVAVRDLQAVTQACRAQLVSYTRGDGRIGFDAANIPVALAERRGDFVAILFHQDNPATSASCVATNPPGSRDVADVATGVGSSGGPALTPPAGRITQFSISQFGDQPASMADGEVGTNVVGVTIHAGNRVVTATVKNGRYAAWWPGKAFPDGPQQPSGEGGPEPILTYDVTLTDGTIHTTVNPRP